MNKKGILFSVASLLLAGFFIITFSSPPETPLDASAESVNFRTTTLERYAESWENFAGTSLRTASYSSLANMAEYISSNQVYFNNLNDSFEECVVNGTLDDGGVNCTGSGKEFNKTVKYWLDSLKTAGTTNLSFNTTYEIKEVRLNQEYPFLATAKMNMSYTINGTIASLKRNVTLEEEVIIDGIKDPLGGGYTDWHRVINQTGIDPSGWNKQNLTRLMTNQTYRHHDDAPSLVQRMQGKFKSSSCCGIEGVLSSSEPSVDFSGDTANSSSTDYLYLRNKIVGTRLDCEDVYTVDGVSNMQMDAIHLTSFNISSSEWTSIC